MSVSSEPLVDGQDGPETLFTDSGYPATYSTTLSPAGSTAPVDQETPSFLLTSHESFASPGSSMPTADAIPIGLGSRCLGGTPLDPAPEYANLAKSAWRMGNNTDPNASPFFSHTRSVAGSAQGDFDDDGSDVSAEWELEVAADGARTLRMCGIPQGSDEEVDEGADAAASKYLRPDWRSLPGENSEGSAGSMRWYDRQTNASTSVHEERVSGAKHSGGRSRHNKRRRPTREKRQLRPRSS